MTLQEIMGIICDDLARYHNKVQKALRGADVIAAASVPGADGLQRHQLMQEG